jgi:Zn-finger nucleic acid-binding protein
MKEIQVEAAHIDECPKCQGRFFDQGEMFAALGATADSSYWDRQETAGQLKEGHLTCPRCEGHMLLQEIRHEKTSVEIDRCNECTGIWLDAGEAEKIMSIGARMADVVKGEQAKAQAELDAMGDVDFRPPSLIFRFLSLFKKKS